MTRQPAEENRIAVAWPMPRLAPVKSSVRRGALDEEGIRVLSFSASCPALPGIHVFGLGETWTWMAGTSYTKTRFAL